LSMFLTATGHRLNINSRGNFQPSLCVDPDDPHFRSEKFNEGLENISRSIVTVLRIVRPWHQINGSINEPLQGVFDCGPLPGILAEILQCRKRDFEMSTNFPPCWPKIRLGRGRP
jgi:hypothetical protein